MEERDGITYYRTSRRRTAEPAGPGPATSSYAGSLALMRRFAARIAEVARAEGAALLHAHSPVLNGLPALWVGRRLGIPVVYEARAFWEDAAVDHGTTHEGSLRYRLTRALETFLFRHADHVVVIAEAMRREIIRRGVDPGRIATGLASSVSSFTRSNACSGQSRSTSKCVIASRGESVYRTRTEYGSSPVTPFVSRMPLFVTAGLPSRSGRRAEA